MPRCAPAASSPRCTPRTSGRRRPASTTARSRRSPPVATAAPASGSSAGETTGYAHTADLSEAGLLAAAEAASAAARAGGGGRQGRRPQPAATVRPVNAGGAVPGDGRQGRQGRAAAARRPGGAGGRRRRSCRSRPATATAASASSSPTRDGLLAEDDQVRTLFRISAVAQRRRRHADRLRVPRPHDRLRAVRPLRRRGAGPRGPPQRALTKLNARPAPSGTLPVVIKARQRRRALPRGVRPRPRGRPRRQGRVGVPRPGRRAGGRHRSSRSSTTARWRGEWGAIGIDDEGHAAQRNVLIQDGVLTDYMWDFLRVAQGGPRRSRATAAGRATSTCRWCG